MNLLYKSLARPLLFKLDPEKAHEFVTHTLGTIAKLPGGRSLLKFLWGGEDDSRLEVKLFGLSFANPFGVAAGLDKDGRFVELFCGLGFGHAEVGTITSIAQEGNPRPRIFRIPSGDALINRMGFPSRGVNYVREKLQKLKEKKLSIVIGGNIGKAKVVSLEQALDDYLSTFTQIKDLVDYVVLNVSSPNTPGLRQLQEPERLKELLGAIQNANESKLPLLVKLAPDLSFEEVDGVLECCEKYEVSGVVATNTTISREGLTEEVNEAGGLSGRPLKKRALEMVSYIYKTTHGKLPIIGVGGISNISDVLDFLKAGASLLQLYTGLVYQGPSLICHLKQELMRYLDEHGYNKVDEVRG